MGDRTTVTLYVPSALEAAAKACFTFEPDEESPDDDPNGICAFTFYEVNYGKIEFLDKLVEVGIPFDSSWDDDGEYSSGTDYCRFTQAGEVIRKEIYDCNINPPMDTLIQYIDEPVVLRAFILEFKEKNCVPDWENQVEYGKRYRAKQLIAPA
jgi:hypothetical protein